MDDYDLFGNRRTIALPDVYGTGELAKFDRAFFDCLRFHQHPSPTVLNTRMGSKTARRNHLKGLFSRRRRELMCLFGIKYARLNKLAERDAPGGIPMGYHHQCNTLIVVLREGKHVIVPRIDG